MLTLISAYFLTRLEILDSPSPKKLSSKKWDSSRLKLAIFWWLEDEKSIYVEGLGMKS
jgi:hypothetical protein